MTNQNSNIVENYFKLNCNSIKNYLKCFSDDCNDYFSPPQLYYTLEISFKYSISSWICLYKNWSIDFFQIVEIQNYVIKNQKLCLALEKSEYFKGGKKAWPSSVYNAELVVEEAMLYTNSFDLFNNNLFLQDFCLHKSFKDIVKKNFHYQKYSEFHVNKEIAKSNFAIYEKNKKDYFNSLRIANWSYSDLIISAICFLYEHVYKIDSSIQNTNKVKIFFYQISFYLLFFETSNSITDIDLFDAQQKTSKLLFDTLRKTNILSIHKLDLITSLSAYFYDITAEMKITSISMDDCRDFSILKQTLPRLFTSLNLNFIFDKKVVTHILTHHFYDDNFSNVKNMFLIYEIFLKKINTFISKEFQKNQSYKKLYDKKVFLLNQNNFINYFLVVPHCKIIMNSERKLNEKNSYLENNSKNYDLEMLIGLFQYYFPSFFQLNLCKIIDCCYNKLKI